MHFFKNGYSRSLLVVILSLQITFFSPFLLAQSGQQCSQSFELNLKDTEKHKEWSPASNIFSDSLPSTIVSSAMWLSFVQLIRFASSGESASYFSDAFLLTLPIDVALTLISHAISVGNIPYLKAATEGKLFGPNYEFATRVASNVLVASSVIVSGWAIAGIDLSSEKVLAAFALCAAVYPSLQYTKNFLFKKVPERKNTLDFKRLKSEAPLLTSNLQTSLQARAKELDISSKDFEASFTNVLDAVVFSEAWELRIKNSELLNNKKIYAKYLDIQKIKKAFYSINSESAAQKLLLKLQSARRALVEQVLVSSSSLSLAQQMHYKNFIHFDKSTSLDENIILLERLVKIHKEKRFMIFSSSIIDQALAVGIAGGILLYHLNAWVSL